MPTRLRRISRTRLRRSLRRLSRKRPRKFRQNPKELAYSGREQPFRSLLINVPL